MAAIYLLYAVPMGLVWMGITNTVSVESFFVGYALSLGMLILTRPRRAVIRWKRLPVQLLTAAVYIALLFRDILLSGIDVARRVLSRDMQLKLGIVAVSTQDPEKSKLIAALSADVITLTPGQLVVELEDDHWMYVHCLDVEESAAGAEAAQKRRLELFKRILGRD